MRLGLLVARSGEQAARVMEQFGLPVLLAVDMTAAEMKGVTLIEAAEAKQQPMLVVAFSTSRAFREYSASRHERLHLDVIRPDAPAEAIKAGSIARCVIVPTYRKPRLRARTGARMRASTRRSLARPRFGDRGEIEVALGVRRAGLAEALARGHNRVS